MQKFKETRDSRYIYQNEIDEACFHNTMWLIEILRICIKKQLLIMHYAIKHVILLKIRNMMDITADIFWIFDEKTSIGGVTRADKSAIIQSVYSSFKDNIWGADLADTQLISKFNKGVWFLCAIDIYSKCAWVLVKMVICRYLTHVIV